MALAVSTAQVGFSPGPALIGTTTIFSGGIFSALWTIFSCWVRYCLFTPQYLGSFQLEFVVISRVIHHMTCIFFNISQTLFAGVLHVIMGKVLGVKLTKRFLLSNKWKSHFDSEGEKK